MQYRRRWWRWLGWCRVVDVVGFATARCGAPSRRRLPHVGRPACTTESEHRRRSGSFRNFAVQGWCCSSIVRLSLNPTPWPLGSWLPCFCMSCARRQPLNQARRGSIADGAMAEDGVPGLSSIKGSSTIAPAPALGRRSNGARGWWHQHMRRKGGRRRPSVGTFGILDMGAHARTRMHPSLLTDA